MGRAHRRAARTPVVLLAALVLASILPATSRAADPGRWVETGFSPIPIPYYQGVTSDPEGRLYFDGFTVGLYRTNPGLGQEAAVIVAIPETVSSREGYNHIGDITWDDAEEGRVLLPLECYVFGIGNFCGTGSIGVADPDTLEWRYYVKLDPADIKKAMWAEVSPDGEFVWTSSGRDLLAYRTSDISPANAAPQAAPIRPIRRLVNAVPPSGVTGATFYGDRLFLAGQDVRPWQVWSIDVDTGERRLEIEKSILGESEGLDVFEGLGGILHWQIGFLSFTGPPTYGSGHNALVHFVPANSPPDCSGLHAVPAKLWPPNHKLLHVSITGATDPDGDPVTVDVIGVTSTEPVDGLGDGRTSPDWRVDPGTREVWLRAERSGRGPGRVYTITVKASDPDSQTCQGTVSVKVPHSGGGKR